MELSCNLSSPRLGFFGGTFDPLHNGHLEIAHTAIQKASLNKLLICPAFHAPLREKPPLFSAKDRLAMLQEVCQDHPVIEVYDAEIKCGKTRYSWETIEEIKSRYPNYELFFILGADQFYRLPQWENVEMLTKWVHFLVFARGSEIHKHPVINNLTFSLMDNSLINISSTNIRKELQKNQLPHASIPTEVATYLNRHNLFPAK